ncbi:HEAT repeat domain-containing protein [Lignipirellula cremea]|uniref:PBS lyase HEAT-like repeat protein n=1 Tax=Lignipirellula cremea TaxID=2528010 RepID=A0A518DZD8_9BACT|nr:HEAT repeat domain-containing protein [Lignipirellula cremea]QDU97199.1 hypothetical protein Pla8534_50440 [Lignipirellula cremea]
MRCGPRIAWSLVLGAAFLSLPGAASADTFRLKNGGEVQGEWINRNQTASTGYLVRTWSGMKITLPADSVAERLSERPAEREYENLAPQAPDTVEGQWSMAQWCRRQQLTRQRKTHLARILELEPDHPEARAALGYSQVGGEWKVRVDWRKEQGYVYYKRRWRLAQEVELMQRRESQEQIARDWYDLILRHREALTPATAMAFRNQVLEIRDPNAVMGLTSLLMQEPDRRVKYLYLEALRNINTPASALAMVVVSLNDPDIEVFHEALAQLAEIDHAEVAAAYQQGLQNKNNVRVNRSGIALGQLGGSQTIEPLIEALVTTHVLVLKPPSDGSDDGVTTLFTNGPTNGLCQTPTKNFAGMTAGNQTKIIPQRVANPEVLAALVRLSGGYNFGYDQHAWRTWQEAEKQRHAAQTSLRP